MSDERRQITTPVPAARTRKRNRRQQETEEENHLNVAAHSVDNECATGRHNAAPLRCAT